MGKIYLCLITIVSLFSCGEKSNDDISQGKLEELIVGEFSLKKDSLTMSFYDLRVIEDIGKEYILFTTSAQKFRGYAFVFADSNTGIESFRFEIPMEGPNSLKVGMLSNIISGTNKIFLINYLGDIGKYDSFGQQIGFTEHGTISNNKANELSGISSRKGLGYFLDSAIFLSQNPSRFLNPTVNLGAGNHKSSFPLDFSAWRIKIDVNSGNVTTSDFQAPVGYHIFENDMTATQLQGSFNSNRQLFYLNWPRSEEIYEIDGVELKRKVLPKTTVKYNFLPSEVIPWGSNSTVWALPKESSTHIFLLYDKKNDLFIRCSKIKESGTGETNFERTKHYVLSIYSGEWEPMGEYFFDFETEIEVENWFLTSEGLFINKPEQESEDEYEFYKIDLSGFGK